MLNHKLSEVDQLYRRYLSEKLISSSEHIADVWLQRLDEILDEKIRDIFPTDLLLDHIPSLIEEIAKIIAEPENDLAVSSSLIARKATSLGQLRHEQNSTVHQLLREYDVLAKILEEFIVEESDNYKGVIEYKDCIQMMSGVAHVVRMILQATVDTFIEKYMSTINDQTEKITSFNKFISHEIKTPLQAAMLNTELMLEDKSLGDENIKELLTIKSSIQQITLLLKNIEDLVDVENNVAESPIIQEVEISKLVKDISCQIEEMLVQHNVEITVSDDLGKTVLEIAKLELILTNILTNAVKYSDPKENKKYIKVEKNISDDNFIELVISDNGLGISTDMQKEVFKLRTRAHKDAEESKDIAGHGLGLFLAQEAAASIDSEIRLDSEEGKGSSFIIRLPKK